MKLGLCGYTVETGIGTITKAMLARLPIASFWHVKQRDIGWGPAPQEGVRCWRYDSSQGTPGLELYRDFLDSIDTVITTERWWPPAMPAAAKEMGKRTVMIVTPEWFNPNAEATKFTDIFIAYNKATAHMLRGLGFGDRTVRLNYPINLADFPFRRREVAFKFLFINGWGGLKDRSGLREVEAALAMKPHLLALCSQRKLTQPFAAEVVLPPEKPAAMYDYADIVVRPSRHEGIGLVLLEALASGCPALTTDGVPMCEYIENCFDSAAGRFLLRPQRSDMITANVIPWWHYIVDPVDIVAKVEALRNRPIAEESMAARRYIETHHGEGAWLKLQDVIRGGS